MIQDVGWAAGFFEGEGNARSPIERVAGKDYAYLRLTIAQVHREPLDAFREVFGKGMVRGPYGPYSGNRQPHYQYMVHGADALIVANEMLPYLFHKGEQIKAALAIHMEHVNDIQNPRPKSIAN